MTDVTSNTSFTTLNSNDDFIKHVYELIHNKEKEKYKETSSFLMQCGVSNKETKRDIMLVIYNAYDAVETVDEFVSTLQKTSQVDLSEYNLKHICEQMRVNDYQKFREMNRFFASRGLKNKGIKYEVINGMYDIYDNYHGLEEFVKASRSLVDKSFPQNNQVTNQPEPAPTSYSLMYA